MIDRIFELHDNLNIVGIDSSLIIYSLKLEDIFMLFVDELHPMELIPKGALGQPFLDHRQDLQSLNLLSPS